MSNWLEKSGFVGETTQYDKKILPDFRKPKSWLKSVSAFANCFGGKLIFGVVGSEVHVDIFDDRMNLMERRGSGFKKIIEAYRDAYLYREEMAPKMFSNAVDFWVVLRNLNYNITENEVVAPKNEVVAPKNEVVALKNEVVAFESYLNELKLTGIMRDHIVRVYERAKVQKVFSRKDVVEWLDFAAISAGGRVMAKLKELELIKPVLGYGKGRYSFRTDLNEE